MSSNSESNEPTETDTETAYLDQCVEEMKRLLDAVSDPFDPNADVLPNEFVAVGEDLGNAWATAKRTHQQQPSTAAHTAAESKQDTDPLAGSLAAARAATDDLPDIEEPRMVERDGGTVAVGECPITPVEMARLVALDDGTHQDVYVRNEEYVRDDSPFVEKYHAKTGCPRAGASRTYSMAGLYDAKQSDSVPCPNCIVQDTSIRTMADALRESPAFVELSKGEGIGRVAHLTSGIDTKERERHERIIGFLARNAAATAEDIADHYGMPKKHVETDLKTMAATGAVAYRQNDDGRTEWQLVGAGDGNR